jgi:glycosyltransferase involved in cell wall biosynthesis
MKNVKISVISPSFNQGKFIEDSILSVLNQNYDNFEHIIIDAGSTDETITILKKYPHIIWVSEKDNGQCDAFNKGISMSSGNIIAWLNVDDYFLPNAFSKFSENYLKTQADYYYADYLWVDTNKTKLKTIKPYKRYSYFLNLLYGCYIPTSGSLIRKEFFEKVGLLDTTFRYKMDTEIFERSRNIKFTKIDSTLSAFRYHGNNVSFRDKKKGSEITKQDMESIAIKDRYFKLGNVPLKIRAYIYKLIWYPARVTYLLLKYSKI